MGSALTRAAALLVATHLLWTPTARSDDAAKLASPYARSDTPPKVARWAPSRGRECRGRGKHRRFCEGPRRVPAPVGAAAKRAKRLGLGTDKALHRLILKAPRASWVSAAGDGATAVDGARSGRLLWPVPDGKQWRGFGWDRRGGRRKWHKGVDIGAPKGTPVFAAQGGLVAYADNGIRGYGNLLAVVHPDGTVALYAHCQALYVFAGQRIARGQRIADVGHTGIARGSHLHFEYRKRGRPRNPARLFDEAR